MSHRKAFTLIELLVVISIVALVIGIMIPAFGAVRRTTCSNRNSANLRGIDQSMVIFGNTNNDYLPGLDSAGEIVQASQTVTGSPTNTGAAFSSRMWMLLNAQYIGPDLLINPQETKAKWKTGAPLETANFSYAGLQIGDYANSLTTEHHAGRAGEWRNNANSQSIMINCRNTGPTNTDAGVQSVFTPHPGDWKGVLVWGDNHAEFQQTHMGFTTRYEARDKQTGATTQPASMNTNDNLFATAAGPGLTEGSVNPEANAMAVYN